MQHAILIIITSVEQSKNLTRRRDLNSWPQGLRIWRCPTPVTWWTSLSQLSLKVFLFIFSGPRKMLFMCRKWSIARGYQRTGMNVFFSRTEFFHVISLQVIKRRPHLWVGKGLIMGKSITTPLKSTLNKQTCLSAHFVLRWRDFLVSVASKRDELVQFETWLATSTLSSWVPRDILDWL